MLNAEQRRAVESTGHCLVIACPGSGKTRLVVSKIGRILQLDRNAKIIAVTFTRDAANELRLRVLEEVGDWAAASCSTTTFHALALAQLKRAKVKIRLVGEAERKSYIIRAIEACGSEMLFEDAAQTIEAAKSTPHYRAMGDAGGQLVQAYQGLLARNKVMDFHDVMLMALRLLRSGAIPVIGATHMMVDEFQDTDSVQYEYIMEYYKAGVTITAVADDDQTIYAFRCAMGYDGLARFERETGATRITLGTNYRSHEEILTAADRLIQCNESRMDKELHSKKGRGGEVKLFRIGDFWQEADTLASEIIEISKTNPIPPSPPEITPSVWVNRGEWAVLARTNMLLDPVQAVFESRGIPFTRTGKTFWSREPASLMLSLLRSIAKRDLAGIDQALHWSGVPESDLDGVHQMIAGNTAHLFSWEGQTVLEYGMFTQYGSRVIEPFMHNLPGWAKHASKRSNERTDMVIGLVARWMENQAENAKDREKRERDKMMIGLAEKVLLQIKGSILQRTTFLQQPRNRDEEAAGVALHTMHGAKGLEFGNVWIIGAEESIVPSAKTVLDGKQGIEEERRLFYVAMTRAKSRLYISSTARNGNFESQFVKEALPGQKYSVLRETE